MKKFLFIIVVAIAGLFFNFFIKNNYDWYANRFKKTVKGKLESDIDLAGTWKIKLVAVYKDMPVKQAFYVLNSPAKQSYPNKFFKIEFIADFKNNLGRCTLSSPDLISKMNWSTDTVLMPYDIPCNADENTFNNILLKFAAQSHPMSDSYYYSLIPQTMHFKFMHCNTVIVTNGFYAECRRQSETQTQPQFNEEVPRVKFTVSAIRSN